MLKGYIFFFFNKVNSVEEVREFELLNDILISWFSILKIMLEMLLNILHEAL